MDLFAPKRVPAEIISLEMLDIESKIDIREIPKPKSTFLQRQTNLPPSDPRASTFPEESSKPHLKLLNDAFGNKNDTSPEGENRVEN